VTTCTLTVFSAYRKLRYKLPKLHYITIGDLIHSCAVFVCVCMRAHMFVCLRAEGKRAAKKRECKYAEISATIGHNVDQLLVGVLQQIRLSLGQAKLRQSSSLSSALSTTRSRAGSAGFPGHLDCRRSNEAADDAVETAGICANRGGDGGCCIVQARHRVLAKIMSSLSLGSSIPSSSVCDNLYVP